MDKYEASEGAGGKAVSAYGVMPWNGVDWYAANSACTKAGKRLCSRDELIDICKGPNDYTYPYGNNYQSAYCNGKDYGEGGIVPTGSLSACEGDYDGIFDLSGNVMEWTSSCWETKCSVVNGAYNNSEDFLKCGVETSYEKNNAFSTPDILTLQSGTKERQSDPRFLKSSFGLSPIAK